MDSNIHLIAFFVLTHYYFYMQLIYVSINVFVPFSQEPKHSHLWEEMKTKGTLRMELVNDVFSKYCQQGSLRDDILNLMEQFGLIAKFASSPTDMEHFVPAQLSSPPEGHFKVGSSSSDPCPLYLQFPAGFVPLGLFTQLVSRCTHWCSGIAQYETKSPNFFQGEARFKLISREFSHDLIMVCKKRFINIVLRNSRKTKSPRDRGKFLLKVIKEMASSVLRFLCEAMTQMLKDLPYLTSLKYHWCVACTECPKYECNDHTQEYCTHDDCLCLRKILQDGQSEVCQNYDGDETTVSGLKLWQFPVIKEQRSEGM